MTREALIELYRYEFLGLACNLMLLGLGQPRESDAGILLARRIQQALDRIDTLLGTIYDEFNKPAPSPAPTPTPTPTTGGYKPGAKP